MDAFSGLMDEAGGAVGDQLKAGAKFVAKDNMNPDAAKKLFKNGLATLGDAIMGDDEPTFRIPHKVKKIIEGGSIKKQDTLQDIENDGPNQTDVPGQGQDEQQITEISESDNKVNLAKLIAHIDQIHPRTKRFDSFDMMDDLGSYQNPYFKLRCFKIELVSDLAKEIGIGPTMFLMSVKQIFKLFFVLMIINMPIYVYLSKTHDALRTAPDILTLFSSFTIGALGQGEPTCSEMDLLKGLEMNLTCGHEYAVINEITSIGISKTNESTCATTQYAVRSAAKDYFVEGCFTNHNLKGQNYDKTQENFLHDEEGLTKFFGSIQSKCKNKNSCNLDMDDLYIRDKCGFLLNERIWHGAYVNNSLDFQIAELFQMRKYGRNFTDYVDRTIRSPGYKKSGTEDVNPLITFTYNCLVKDVIVSGGAGGFQGTVRMNKTSFGILMVLIDVWCTLILIAFYKTLERQQEIFVEKFDLETLTVSDFTYQISNMPPDEFFNFDDNIFRMRLYLQFEKILQEQGERENPLMPQDFMDCKYQLTDVQFAKNNNKESQILNEYLDAKEDRITWEKRKEGFELTRTEGGACYDPIKFSKRQIAKHQARMDKIKKRYQEYKIGDRKMSVTGQRQTKPSSGCECCKKKTTIYTFVTFRSFDGKELFMRSYETFKSRYLRYWVLACGCCCPKVRDHLKSLYIGGKWPIIEEPVDADNIAWNNLSVSERNRRMRIRITNLIGTCALLLSFIILVGLNARSMQYKEDFITPISCPEVVSKQQAYDDQFGPKKESLGLMHCYCTNLVRNPPSYGFDIDEVKFDDIKPGGGNICSDWGWNLVKQKANYQGQAWLLNFINSFFQATFTALVVFQRRNTLNEKTVEAFKYKIFFMFINMAVIPLLTTFRLADGAMGSVGLFDGAYDDFSVEWYREVGATICYSTFLNTFQPHFNLYIEYLKLEYKRLKDRDFLKDFRADDGEVVTKKVTQDDLNDLYTGDEVDGSTLYCNFIFQLVQTFTFSGGLPVLYFIAFFNYVALYWSYKFLFIKFYRKTIEFNHGLPMQIVKFFEFAIGAHLIVTFFMITNRDIMEPEGGFIQDAIDGTSFTSSSGGRRLQTIEEAKKNIDRFASRFGTPIAVAYESFIGVIVYLRFFRKPTQQLFNRTIGKRCSAIIKCMLCIVRCIIACIVKCLTCCCNNDEEQPKIFSDDLIAELKMQSLFDLLKRSEREYRELRMIPVEALPWDCEPTMLENAKTSYKKRIQAIHEKIDNLAKLALKEGGASFATPMMLDGFDYSKLPASLKWAVAVENSKLVGKRVDEERMAILRMKGVTQSYDMYDSQLYRRAKRVQKEINS